MTIYRGIILPKEIQFLQIRAVKINIYMYWMIIAHLKPIILPKIVYTTT